MNLIVCQHAGIVPTTLMLFAITTASPPPAMPLPTTTSPPPATLLPVNIRQTGNTYFGLFIYYSNLTSFIIQELISH